MARPKGKTGFYVHTESIQRGLEMFRDKSRVECRAATEKAGLQLLEWMANGTSPKNSDAPPIRWGVLAASGSVFVGGKFIADTSSRPVSKGSPTPNRQLQNIGALGNKINVTIGFNTDYAKKMHESKGMKAREFSKKSGNRRPGNQWVLSHLRSDAELFMQSIATFLGKVF